MKVRDLIMDLTKLENRGMAQLEVYKQLESINEVNTVESKELIINGERTKVIIL